MLEFVWSSTPVTVLIIFFIYVKYQKCSSAWSSFLVLQKTVNKATVRRPQVQMVVLAAAVQTNITYWCLLSFGWLWDKVWKLLCSNPMCKSDNSASCGSEEAELRVCGYMKLQLSPAEEEEVSDSWETLASSLVYSWLVAGLWSPTCVRIHVSFNHICSESNLSLTCSSPVNCRWDDAAEI